MAIRSCNRLYFRKLLVKITMRQLRQIIKEACWDGYSPGAQTGVKTKDSPTRPGKRVPNCEEINEYDVVNEQDYKQFKAFLEEMISVSEGPVPLEEAEYRGRKVKLNKPMQGDVAKFKVYVKNPKGNVVKVNFGAKGMRIRKNNPKARKSFRARHRCDKPGPRHKARYWSCRKW